MSSKHRNPPDIHAEAVQWAKGFREDDPTERERFVKWLTNSPQAWRELLVADLLNQELPMIDPERTVDLDQLIADAQSNVSPIGPHVDIKAPTSNPRRRRIRMMLVASVASVAAIVAGVWLSRSTELPEGLYATAIGEQRVVTLDDGSVLSLNTQSRVQVRYSAASRDIFLMEGQAAFKVMHETRPFYVHAGAAKIRDIGTEFDVRFPHPLAGSTTLPKRSRHNPQLVLTTTAFHCIYPSS